MSFLFGGRKKNAARKSQDSPPRGLLSPTRRYPEAYSESERPLEQRWSQPTEPKESLYPWSKRELVYTPDTPRPFPRYGPAIPSVATKEGDTFIMGGLVDATTVKSDLWRVETAAMTCSRVATTGDGPGPRVGHTSLLIGNAFIVHGGDTKIEETDILDETLYLLNTATLHWSRAIPNGARPRGRYGHTLNILGSKIFIFGGQDEGFFFNDLSAFDLNGLQSPDNQWETLQRVGDSPDQPAGRTNHTMVTYKDKLYLFGGTNGEQWFNDVWCWDPHTNKWSELDCIGYIPVAREGHAAAIVDDVMYGFGGRTEEGADLGDLVAFRIPSRRWYTFQNMGPAPSPRSGLGMTIAGKSIFVMGGEPSSAGTDKTDLSLVHVLDTKKIRYPPEPTPVQEEQNETVTQNKIPKSTTDAAILANAGATPDKELRTAKDMESYYGYVRTPEDAIKLFEACRKGLLPRVRRGLLNSERKSIRSGSVFVWDEVETGIKKWTDGKHWSAGRASGNFLTYLEIEPKASNKVENKRSGSVSDSDSDFGLWRSTAPSYSEGKVKADGFTKLSCSTTTATGQKLHLISYFLPAQPVQPEMKEPSTDPALRDINPFQGMYPALLMERAPSPGELTAEKPHPTSRYSSSESVSSVQDPSLFSGPSLDAQSATETTPTSYIPSISAAVSRPEDKLLMEKLRHLNTANIPEERIADDDWSDDGQSQFSAGSRGLPPSIDHDVSRIIEQLVTDSPALHNNVGSTAEEGIWQILPELLKAFAVKIGYGDQPAHIREIMFFVRQYRNSLASRLRGHVADLDDQSQVASSLDGESDSSGSDDFEFRIPEPGMSVTEKMEQLWSDPTKFEPLEDEKIEDTTETPEVAEAPSLNAHDIKNSVAYTWLLGALSAEATSMVVGADARTQIRESMLNFLWSQERKRGPRKFRPRARAPEHHVSIALNWDPVAFLKSQGWDGITDASSILATSLTLTGSDTDCQALTTEAYLAQTWPSTGLVMMGFVGLLISGKPDAWNTVTLPDQTVLEGRIIRGQTRVDIKGSAPSVSEAAEQLIWMGCALQTSTQASTLSYCTYDLTRLPEDAGSVDSDSKTADHSFATTFRQQPVSSGVGEHQCWHSMFRNPTIARGFPIKRRAMKSAGLEMPLEMMAQMMRATRIIAFNAVWYLKGFSSFLALSECRDDELLWHHVYKNDGSYAAFSDFEGATSSFDLSASQLQRSRHIIGWCQKADLRAGAILGNEFDGSPSKLRRPHATCVLKEATLTAGYNINAQAVADIGVRAQPLHLPKGGDYWVKINKVRQHYFLLWDEGSKRGWLINGASAMLHLLLARIQYDIVQGRKLAPLVADFDDPMERFRHWKALLNLPPDPYSPAAARHILENEANKSLPIFVAGDDFRKETPTFVTLFDEVNDMFSLLEQVFEHENMVRHRNGVDIKPMFRPRKHLEGWDFIDIAERRPDPVYPRLKELPQMGKCWVDFTRGINASTLFARGFGELIEPTSGYEVCNTLARLPSHQNLLGVCASDMKDILRMYSIEDDDDTQNGPTEVLEGLFWIQSPDPFQDCRGKGKRHAGAECCDATQVLAPKQTLSKLWKWGSTNTRPSSHIPIDLDGKGASGALFFGFTRNRPVYYQDDGEPTLEKPEEVRDEATQRHEIRMADLAPLGSSTSGVSTSISTGGNTNATSKLFTDSTSRTDDNSLQGSDKQIALSSGTSLDHDAGGLKPPAMAPSKKKLGLKERLASKLKLGREAN
ncbi:gti1/Pac2 family protein [Sarocladium implicatum]|nr:gti1/Pac2 family protein [Sarocladium implicatum]